MVIPYLSELINIQKTNENNPSEWKIQLTMDINMGRNSHCICME